MNLQVISRLTLDVERAQTRLLEREQDLQAMQDGTRRLGETHSEDRFALELEVERYRRDLEHAEDDLERTRKDLERKEAALGQREDALAGLVRWTYLGDASFVVLADTYRRRRPSARRDPRR